MNPRARLLALHALTCVTAFLLCLAGTASGKAALSPEKTASGEFFGHFPESTWQTAPETLQPQWEIDPATTQTASGRQVWLSADPLESVTGEMAELLPEGPNLYGYGGNDPIRNIDPLGLDIWIGCNAAGHQNISVGIPEGIFDSYTYGVQPNDMFMWSGLKGTVYRDTRIILPSTRGNRAGKVRRINYLKTTPEQDKLMREVLRDQVGDTGGYFPGPGMDCRDFSQNMFKWAQERFAKKPTYRRLGRRGR